MTIKETFIKADEETLNNVVAQIKDGQWNMQVQKSKVWMRKKD